MTPYWICRNKWCDKNIWDFCTLWKHLITSTNRPLYACLNQPGRFVIFWIAAQLTYLMLEILVAAFSIGSALVVAFCLTTSLSAQRNNWISFCFEIVFLWHWQNISLFEKVRGVWQRDRQAARVLISSQSIRRIINNKHRQPTPSFFVLASSEALVVTPFWLFHAPKNSL